VRTYDFFDGIGAAHYPRASDGRAVFDGHGGWLQSGFDGRRSNPAHVSFVDDCGGNGSPARVLVLGAGVAGLQAIATARRLGAVVEAYDVRAAAGEQVRSLGAKFLDVDLGGIQTEDKGGYAVELSEEALKRGRDLIAEQAKSADVIITTAQVPDVARQS
jgi:NAD/NADP transhydrogenase alpha subunit